MGQRLRSLWQTVRAGVRVASPPQSPKVRQERPYRPWIGNVRAGVCRHVGEIPQVAQDPEVLPDDLKPSLRCSQCGTLGEVEVRLGWSGGGESL